jgi:transcriptional regulator PpsR
MKRRIGKSSSPDPSLREPDAAAAGSSEALLTMASDITLILDAAGSITKVSLGHTESPIEDAERWIGQRWSDIVTAESRRQVEHMLRELAATGLTQRRHINHLTGSGADIPVAYTAMRVAHSTDVIAVGRDLRPISALQQRLVETQQTMERDYWHLRHVETRYRLVFQVAREAILVLDAATLEVVEANAAAEELLALQAGRLVGMTFPLGLAAPDMRTATDLLSRAQTLGHAHDARVRLAHDGREMAMSATCFRQDTASLFMVRLSAAHGAANGSATSSASRVMSLVANAPDAIVLTDADGGILSANRAFLDIAQLESETQAVGHPMAQWIGRPGADVAVFLGMLRQHGCLRLIATAARGEHGGATEVEVSAIAVPGSDPPSFGFILRDVGRRFLQAPRGARDLTRAVEELTVLVGRVGLRDLIRDTTDLVERHFIEAALELTGHNRTAAAEVLGLSRQSLYVKLHRYGLAAVDNTVELEVS